MAIRASVPLPLDSVDELPPSAALDAPCSAESHERLRADLGVWQALPLDNYWHHDGATHELRCCPRCGSSLMQRIEIVAVRYPDRVAA